MPVKGPDLPPPVFDAALFGAMPAGPEEASLLGLQEGEAVLRVRRVLHASDGRPLVWFRTLYRADRYEYEIELRRQVK
jgi:GntR family transcriptional regulator